MADKVDIKQLIVVDAYKRTFKTGSVGFAGKVINPETGKKYQVTAIEIGSKPK